MKHSNINIDRASLTGEEIQKGQDFSQLLKAHHAQFAKPWYQNPLNYVWVGSIMAVALGAWYFMTPKHQEVVPDYQVVAFAEENNPQDLIAPPMPEIDSPFSTYSVNADRGGMSLTARLDWSSPRQLFKTKKLIWLPEMLRFNTANSTIRSM